MGSFYYDGSFITTKLLATSSKMLMLTQQNLNSAMQFVEQFFSLSSTCRPFHLSASCAIKLRFVRSVSLIKVIKFRVCIGSFQFCIQFNDTGRLLPLRTFVAAFDTQTMIRFVFFPFDTFQHLSPHSFTIEPFWSVHNRYQTVVSIFNFVAALKVPNTCSLHETQSL